MYTSGSIVNSQRIPAETSKISGYPQSKNFSGTSDVVRHLE